MKMLMKKHMKIKTQFVVTMLLFGAILIVAAVSAIVTQRQIEMAGEQETIAAAVSQGAGELGHLSTDYLIYREPQLLKRWKTRFAAFSEQVAALDVDEPEQQALAANIRASKDRMKVVFDSVSTAPQRPPGDGGAVVLDPAFLQVSWSRMAVQTQALSGNALRLSQLLHRRMDQLAATRTLLMYIMVALFGVFLLSSYLITYRRILKSIAVLRAGTAVIGSGNLDFIIEEKKDDEIGELTRAFNKMTADLKTVTSSKVDLLREMSERRQAEKALRESEQRWAVTLTSIGDAVITSDAEGLITFLNPVAEELTGWSLAEAAGKPVQEVFHIFNERTRAVVDDPVRKVLSSGLMVGLANHTVLLRKDGRELPIDDSAAPIRDEAGHILGVVLIFRDITERRKAENTLRESETKYRTLFENMTEEVHFWQVVRDETGRIKTWRLVDVNPPALKTWGKNTVDEIKGKTTDEIFGPGATEHYLPVVQKIITEGIPIHFEDYFPHLDKYFKFTSVPIGDRFITTGSDITDIKKAEKSLRQLNETLEQQVAERTALAAARSNQLQSLAVELIEAEERERQRIAQLLHDDLQQLLASAKMQLNAACAGLPANPLLANVEKLLEDSIAKSRGLSHELSPAVLYHSGLVAGMQWLAGQMEKQFGLQVTFDNQLEKQYDLELKGFVFRSVQELLFNVVKHASVQQARVVLRCTDDHLSVSVSDEGCGFNPDSIDSSSQKAGFGLLSIRERASYVGGGLIIESVPGKGSRFTLLIPAAVPQTQAVPAAGSETDVVQVANVTWDTAPTNDLRVIFADDHEVMRHGLIRLVNGQPDIKVVGEAANGRQALDLARKLNPDVIVMDISMPEMDGIEATRRIKTEMPHVRVIGLSMIKDEHLTRAMHEAGAEVYLSKTASSAELLKAIYGLAREHDSSLKN
ncbi:MAG: response regulator [Desulfobacteraceae bacterium]|nr:MAG: response regulator [Desulfobacteraceae bacterium]